MGLMTGKEYIESIRKLDLNVYMLGEKIENVVDDPILRPSLNSVKATYELAEKPEYEDLMTAKSILTGDKINRFTHLHKNTDDLIKKVKMQRLLGQNTASCFQRCVGMDSFNSLFSTTYEIDQKHNTKYHENFKSFMEYVQEKDLTVDGAMVHQTGITNSHEVLVMPTIAMREDDKDYAISFAVPTDSDGITIIVGRQSCDTRKKEKNADIDVGNRKYGGTEALVIFEDVFVPNDRIFLNGETEFAGMLIERFAGYHRQSYGGCKVGVGDVLIGSSALITEYNGITKASHIKDKLIEMCHLNETLYACGIACSAEGYKTKAGNYQIDLLLANVCKQNVTRFPYEIARLAEDIAGGLMVTLPSQKDYENPVTGKYMEKYLKGANGVPAIKRMKVFRLIENLTLGTAAVGYRTESMHGAGSPQAQRIMIGRQANIEQKKELAKAIANIED